jgi:hypothetical protein
MLESVWNFRGYILNESAAECHVQELGTTADCEQRQPHLARCLNESYLGFVAGEVGFTAMRRSGLSIQRRFYIFAAGEKQPVHAGQNRIYGIVGGERRNDEWY